MKSPGLWMTVVIQLASVAPAGAQPWAPPQGEGTVSVTYQNYYVTGHFDVFGRENTNGATHAKAMVAEVDFGLSDTIAVTISVPFIATKYTGPQEYFVGGHATHSGPLDDKAYHGAVQDVRVEARRVCWAGPIAFAPLASVVIPSHDYETHGEAVPGRHRRELQVGVTAGADLNRIIPRTYLHGQYSLATAERLHGFSSVRSIVDVEGGFDVSRRIALRGLTTWQIRHKGPTIAELAADDWFGHDRFMVSSYFNVGGGMTMSITRNTELHALWVATVSGKGGAHRARMLAIGTSWSFGSGLGGMGGFGGFAAIKNERSRSTPPVPGF
jgi:hypothetical protein